jgi:transcription antitermination factor NusG
MSATSSAYASYPCQDPVHTAKWFAVYTATHHEKHVAKKLADRQIESFVPLYKARRHWSKRSSVEVDLPLFANYVFVRIARGEQTTVLKTPGVYSVVGDGYRAWEIPEQEIITLQRGLQLRRAEPHPYLVVGERARIKSGVFSGLEGVILRNKDNLQVVLSLVQIMQSISIEVSAAEVEPLDSPRSVWDLKNGMQTSAQSSIPEM